jgi:hypothetical protein
MKKIALFLMISYGVVYASSASLMYQLYQRGEYAASCELGFNHFKEFKSNEGYVSLYAFACLKADNLDRLVAPLGALSSSPEARANASYFAMVVFQKELLIHALYDNYSLKGVNFPVSSHLLSRIFALYRANPQSGVSIKEYTDPTTAHQTYKLYPLEVNGKKTIAIDEYYDKILTLHHIY